MLGGGITCCGDAVYIRVDYTMTLDPSTNQTVAALSIYGFDNYSAIVDRVYTALPNDSRNLNERMCTPNNRKGFLCEDCVDGFGPTAYSPKCTNCSELHFAARLAGFFAVKLVPITIMFVLLAVFRINVTYGPVFGYVIFCQATTSTARLLLTFNELFVHQLGDKRKFFNILHFLSAFWDMDYGALFGKSCISPSLKNIDVLFLNFVSVFYPFVLVALSYAFIQLHSRNFRLIVLRWKPFSICLLKFRKDWNITGSIVHAYATVFLLSFCIFNFNAFMILKSIGLYAKQKRVKTILYYQPSFPKRSVYMLCGGNSAADGCVGIGPHSTAVCASCEASQKEVQCLLLPEDPNHHQHIYRHFPRNFQG